MWDYTPFLLALVPAVLVVFLSPNLLARRFLGRFVFLTVSVWFVACLVFTGMLVPFGGATHIPAVERYIRLFLMVSVVVSIPVIVAAVSQLILVRQRVATSISMAVSTLASSATIFVLPPIALFAACAFVDPSCI